MSPHLDRVCHLRAGTASARAGPQQQEAGEQDEQGQRAAARDRHQDRPIGSGIELGFGEGRGDAQSKLDDRAGRHYRINDLPTSRADRSVGRGNSRI
jgi:hypothetical protein